MNASFGPRQQYQLQCLHAIAAVPVSSLTWLLLCLASLNSPFFTTISPRSPYASYRNRAEFRRVFSNTITTVLRDNVEKRWVWYRQRPSAAARNGKDITNVCV